MTTETITLRGREISQADILSRIAECDRLGQSAFLTKYGYQDSVRYHLRHSGRSYPSKAILGAAAGLGADDFFGGARETVALLGRLGFHVRNSQTGEMVDELGLDALRKQAVADGFDDPAPEWDDLPVTPSAYFLSGSNRPSEIAALGKVGADIGVAANEVGSEAEKELAALAGSDVLVFIDSGAFSEFQSGKEIPESEWVRRLALYRRLVGSLGAQAFVVAPDKVGSQTVTLERLARYRSQVLELIELGARVLVPIQKGAMSQADFAAHVDLVLGTDRWIPALPCKAAATSPEEVAAFVAARRPKHVHLLGLGIRNRKVAEYLAPFVSSSSSVSLDSCWIRGNCGHGKVVDGKRVGQRRFTKAREFAHRVLKRLGLDATGIATQLAVYLCLAAPVPVEGPE